jgi:uncharacterized protein
MMERALRFYRVWLSPALHSVSGMSGACRFQPTCSEYGAIAVQRHGVVRGVALAVWRVLRCHPFARGGFDPVPGTYAVEGSSAAGPRVRLGNQGRVESESIFPASPGTDEPSHLP